MIRVNFPCNDLRHKLLPWNAWKGVERKAFRLCAWCRRLSVNSYTVLTLVCKILNEIVVGHKQQLYTGWPKKGATIKYVVEN